MIPGFQRTPDYDEDEIFVLRDEIFILRDEIFILTDVHNVSAVNFYLSKDEIQVNTQYKIETAMVFKKFLTRISHQESLRNTKDARGCKEGD